MENKVLELDNFEITNEDENDNLIVNIEHLIVNRGDAIILMGNNGSGKSTIAKAIFSTSSSDNYFDISEGSHAKFYTNGYDQPLELNGDYVNDEIQIAKSYVYIEQEDKFGYFDDILKSLKLPAKIALEKLEIEGKDQYLDDLVYSYALNFFEDIYKYEKKYRKSSKVDKEKLALKILKKKRSNDCSGGQKKLISLLQNLIKLQVVESDMLIVDEPLNHLDQKNKSKISKLLYDIREKRKNTDNPLTMIVISHCLVFEFIKDDNCIQYKLNDKKLEKIPQDQKIYHDCLKSFN